MSRLLLWLVMGMLSPGWPRGVATYLKIHTVVLSIRTFTIGSQKRILVAQYKYAQFLKSNTSDAFDALHQPGATTPYSGIYRCEVCGKEDVSVYSKPLPPQNHHQHESSHGPILWRLIVSH